MCQPMKRVPPKINTRIEKSCSIGPLRNIVGGDESETVLLASCPRRRGTLFELVRQRGGYSPSRR
jgi:hypothetical protein